jgi:pSer/pThr/pTyr-binding forkhead associated (FHA) protein
MEAAESEIRAAAAEAASRAAEAGEVTRPRPKGRKRAAAPVVRLTVAEEGQLPRQYVVDRERVVLGRGKCDIKVSDPEVSREHCAIETRDGVAILRDLKSANGTVLNGHLVNEHALKDGDRIAIGTTVVEISVAKAA